MSEQPTMGMGVPPVPDSWSVQCTRDNSSLAALAPEKGDRIY